MVLQLPKFTRDRKDGPETSQQFSLHRTWEKFSSLNTDGDVDSDNFRVV